MPVSSVNAGLNPNQSPSKNGGAAAIVSGQGGKPVVAQASIPIVASETKSDSSIVNLGNSSGTAIPYGNRVGVAAYVAMMNQQNVTSMRTEA